MAERENLLATLLPYCPTYYSTTQVPAAHGWRRGAGPGYRVQQDRHIHLHGARGDGPSHPARIMGKYLLINL